jgi:hypothetical protein
MEDKEVLQKAIEIAIENGMKIVYYNKSFVFSDEIGQNSNYEEYENRIDLSIVFSHDFAKAFFKNIKPKPLTGQVYNTSYYHDFELHLMQMVICDNPIDYLRKFIDNTEKTD